MKALFEQWKAYLDEDVSDEQFQEFKEFVSNLPKHFTSPQKIVHLKDYVHKYFNTDDYVGSGHSKVVFQFDNDTILKISSPQKLQDEEKVFEKYPSLVPKIIEKGDCWILQEKVNVIKSAQEFIKWFPQTLEIIDEYFDDYGMRPLEYVYQIGFLLEGLTLLHDSDYFFSGLLVDSENEEVADQPKFYLRQLKHDLLHNSDNLFKGLVTASRELGIVLDDIKNDNAGITEDGRFVIIDF